MAMFLANGPLQDATGRMGGVFIREMPCSNQIVRPPRRIRREPTEPQTARWKAFRYCLSFWINYVPQIAAGAWNYYSYVHPKTNKKGQQIFWSGLMWFLHFNIARYINGVPLLLVPPPDF